MHNSLGTVLPTADSLRRGEAHARAVAQQQARIGATLGGDARTIGGEVRYYKTPELYAVVSRALVVRWFAVRADGDYPVAAPRA